MIEWVRSARAQGGAEANLLLLGVVGSALFLTLVATLFAVQSSLVGSQSQLANTTLPAEQALGRLESSIGAMFQRQAQVSSTRNSEQLGPLRDRGALVAALQAQVDELGARSARRAKRDTAEETSHAALETHVIQFLENDAALLAIVSRDHELSERFEKQLAATDADLRQVIEAAQSTAGLLQLDFVLRLRRVADNLSKGQPNAADVREIVLGTSRAQQDDVNQLVQSILSVGWLTGKIGLAQSSDNLNSISGNELVQARAKVRGLIVQLKLRAAAQSEVRERVEAFEKKFESAMSRIADDKGDGKSLVSLRRDILQQLADAASVREKSVRTAQALTRDVSTLREAVKSSALRSLTASERTSWVSRLASILVALLGLGGCLFAGGRIGHSVGDLRTRNQELSDLRDSLQQINANLESMVAQRTQALTRRDSAMQLVLDSMREGLLSTDLDGAVLSERSRAVSTWFGDPGDRAPVRVWDYLFADDERARGEFRRQFSQVAEDIMPFELTSTQLPHRLVRAGRSFDLEFLQVFEEGRFVAVLIVISDVTAQLEALSAERAAREEQELIAAFIRDRRGFRRSIQECVSLLETFAGADDPVVARRALHTLKGSAAMLGLAHMAGGCHAVESALEPDALATREQIVTLQQHWHTAVESLAVLVGDAASKLEVDENEIVAVAEGLRTGRDRAELQTMVESWRLAATDAPLLRISRQAERIAERVGKSLEVEVDHNGIRVPPDVLEEFWANLVHAARNAVDHGIETREERAAAGKPPAGKLRLATTYDDRGDLIVEVSDDGRGIDFDRLRAVAQIRGLPHDTEADLVEAMFADGVTTAETATELSGRGVGTSALREACRRLGGAVGVETVRGVGTRFTFTFPSGELWAHAGATNSAVPGGAWSMSAPPNPGQGARPGIDMEGSSR